MNIRDIRIDAFGQMQGRRFAPERAVTLFYGPNEAGKSTLMAFIRAILFGIPPRSAAADSGYEPLSGGPYGGALTLETEDGATYRVERVFAGSLGTGGRGRSGGGRLRVTRLGDAADPAAIAVPAITAGKQAGGSADEALLKQLLGGVQGELFRSVFAFGLGELQELGTLQTDEVAGFLYSAGWGAQGAAIASAERRLAQEMDRGYRPRGKTQEIALLVKRLEDEQSALRRSKEKTAQYMAWQEEAGRLEREIAETAEALRDVRETAVTLERLRRSREYGLRLLAVDRRLGELPVIGSFPPDALVRFESMLAERQSLGVELSERQAKREELGRRLESLSINEELLGLRPRLDALLERAGAYKDALTAIGAMQTEAEADGQAAAMSLARLGGGWTAAELAAYPLAVADRERMREAKTRRDELKRAEELARAESERASGELEQAERIAAAARARLGEAALALSEAGGEWEPGAAAMRRKLGQLGSDYAEWSRLRQELKFLRQREDDLRLLREPPAAAVRSGGRGRRSRADEGRWRQWLRLALPVAAGAAVAALLWRQGEAALAAVTLAAFAATAWWMRPGAARPPAGGGEAGTVDAFAEERATLSGELKRLEAAIRERVKGWGQPPLALAHAVARDGNGEAALAESWYEETRQAADYWLEARSGLERREAEVAEAAETAAECGRLAERALDKLHEAAGRCAEAEAEWRDWLRDKGINSSLSPDGALEWQLIAEQGKQQLQRRDTLLARLAAAEKEAAAFERDTLALCGPAAQSDPIYALKRRRAEAETEEARSAERELLLRSEAELAVQETLSSRRMNDVAERIAALWCDAEADSEDVFRERERYYAERSALLREREELAAALDSIVGAELREEVLQAARRPPEELDAELERLSARQAELERGLDERRDRRGRLRGDMEKLEDGEEHADKLQRVQETVAELEQAARRWAISALALGLFGKTRSLYETERQPAVLRRASGYFAAMTGGRYSRIAAPVGENRLLAVNPDGEPIDSAKLSRGAAEQLYLAMRFALADETAPAVCLPLVMDDIFVNFDGDRLRRCLELLPPLAERRQLLLFTCHEHIIRAASAAVPGLHVVRL
ncbi:AAA family ATPase [Paenibacillus ginsengarvi]|nr:AAA family ATPase [Paenibacillus ginsengarvi]